MAGERLENKDLAFLASSVSFITISNVIFVRNIYDKFTNSYRLNEGLEILKRKLLSFPYVDHDDVIDAFSQLLLFVYKDRRYMVYGKSFNDDIIAFIFRKEKNYLTAFLKSENAICINTLLDS